MSLNNKFKLQIKTEQISYKIQQDKKHLVSKKLASNYDRTQFDQPI